MRFELRIWPRQAIARWVLGPEGVGRCFLPGYKAIGVFDGERLLSAVVYDGFTGTDCNMHVRILDRRSISRRILRAAFDYPFRQLCLDRVSAQVMDDNEESLLAVQKLGFVYEGAKRLKDKSQLLFGMLRHECQWITEPNEYKFSQMLKESA